MAQPEMSSSELEHGQELGGVLFLARGEAPEVFNTVEEPLDSVARAIEHRAETGLPAAVDHWRDVGRCSGGFDLPS